MLKILLLFWEELHWKCSSRQPLLFATVSDEIRKRRWNQKASCHSEEKQARVTSCNHYARVSEGGGASTQSVKDYPSPSIHSIFSLFFWQTSSITLVNQSRVPDLHKQLLLQRIADLRRRRRLTWSAWHFCSGQRRRWGRCEHCGAARWRAARCPAGSGSPARGQWGFLGFADQ